MAAERGQSLPTLIRDIDQSRVASNLSSAVRISVLRWYRGQAREQPEAP